MNIKAKVHNKTILKVLRLNNFLSSITENKIGVNITKSEYSGLKQIEIIPKKT